MVDHGKRRALIVNDNPLIRRYTTCALSERGFICDSASDGTEALELIESERYSVVVTDSQRKILIV